MTKVFVTGATGYIGRHVIQTLLDMGMNVSSVNYKNRPMDERVSMYDVDIFADDTNIYELVGLPDVCIHLAWTDGFVHNSEAHLKNLYDHYHFIKRMTDGGLKNISVLGTMHEIGYFEGEINEHTPTNPYSLYGIAKNSLRQALEMLFKEKDISFKWLRAYYIVGDDENNKSIFAKIIQAEKEGKKSFPFTTGENQYDFIHVRELSEQIVKASLQDKVTGIIECCSGTPISLKDKVEQFLQDNNFSIQLEYGVFPTRAYDSPAVWGSAEKIQTIIDEWAGRKYFDFK